MVFVLIWSSLVVEVVRLVGIWGGLVGFWGFGRVRCCVVCLKVVFFGEVCLFRL